MIKKKPLHCADDQHKFSRWGLFRAHNRKLAGNRTTRERFSLGRSRVRHWHLDRGVTGDTLAAVKTISIKELHARTGHWVRAAKTQAIVVTDRGEKVASLQPHTAATPVVKFRRRDWSKLPASPFDSTIFISEDRDGR